MPQLGMLRSGIARIAVSAILAGVLAGSASAASVVFDGTVVPVPLVNVPALQATDLSFRAEFGIDPTIVPSAPGPFGGWGFTGVVVSLELSLGTSGLLVPATTPTLSTSAPTLLEPDPYSLGLIGSGTSGGDYWVALSSQPLTSGGASDSGLTFPEFPDVTYHVETVQIGLSSAVPIPGFSDPPLAAEYLTVLPAIDLAGPDITGLGIELFFVTLEEPGNPSIPFKLHFQGQFTSVTVVPVPASLILLAVPLFVVSVCRRGAIVGIR